jgi:hypothetical protein
MKTSGELSHRSSITLSLTSNGIEKYMGNLWRKQERMATEKKRWLSITGLLVSAKRIPMHFCITGLACMGLRAVLAASLSEHQMRSIALNVALRAKKIGNLLMNHKPRTNPALNLAPFSRWTMRDKAAPRRLALR